LRCCIHIILDQSGNVLFARFGAKNISDFPEAKMNREHVSGSEYTVNRGSKIFYEL
jgi:hypothetical protein